MQSILISNYQQCLSDDRVTVWVFCLLCLSVSTFTISLFVLDSTPKSCGLETKGTQTWLINQRSRGYGYLPINQCGGATYNQTNRAGRRAVIQAMMSLSLSLWVLMLVVGLWFGVCVSVWGNVCKSGSLAVGMCVCVSRYLIVGLQLGLYKCLWSVCACALYVGGTISVYMSLYVQRWPV